MSADTDVFVLLCSFYKSLNWSQSEVYMASFGESKSIISISKTVEEQPIISSLIGVHALSGCDSVPALFGIGKTKALGVSKKMELNFIRQRDSKIEDVLLEGRQFVAGCYGLKGTDSSVNRLV